MCVRVRAGMAMAISLIERNEQWDVDEYAIESQRVGLSPLLPPMCLMVL